MFSHLPRTILALLAIAILLPLGATANAQGREQTDPSPIEKGRSELGLLVGVGHAMDIWGGLPDSEFVTVGLDVGYVATNPILGGPCRGNLVLGAELYPAIFFRETGRTTYGASAAAIMRYYFSPGARVRPFISAGGGVVVSANPIPRDISRVNFTPQGGGGVSIALRRGARLSMEYRIHHMSDGVLTDYNPGANSNEFQIGMSWIR
jgi:opacity protein-like surface antigen